MFMVRLALILLCAVCAGFGFRDVAFVGSVGKGPPASCATTDTTLPHDILLEGFNGTDYETNFVETGTVNPDANTSSMTTEKPTGACDEGFSVSVSDSVKYAEKDFGELLTLPVDVYFYFYFSGIQDGELFSIAAFSSDVTPGAGSTTIVNMMRSGSTYQVRALGDSNSDWNTDLVAGQWNKIKLHIETGAGNGLLTVNDGTSVTFSAQNFSARYLAVGQVQAGSGTAGTLYFDLVTVDAP